MFMGASGDTYQPHSPYKLLLLQYFHWAHNPKVVGSNPTPATMKKVTSKGGLFYL